VKLFLDTSVLLAACGSPRGASWAIFDRAAANHWELICTPYGLHEVVENLPEIGAAAPDAWRTLRPRLVVMDDILTLDRPAVFEPAKDRPILFSACAWAEVLLTLDQADFGDLFGGSFYGLLVLTPAMFLRKQRQAGQLA
jgi:hypothetical protein